MSSPRIGFYRDRNAAARAHLTYPVAFSRRQFLQTAGGGLGALALDWLMHEEKARAASRLDGPLAPRAPHFPPKAKSVIYLFMHGGPSHLETFDPKPDLQRLAGQPLPASFGPVATRRKVAHNPLLATRRTFRKCGQSGIEISDFLPHLAECADDLAVIRSCWADSVNHPQAVYEINTGSILMGKPSLGSWVSYGLGTENQDLPAFLVLPDPAGGIKGGPPAYGAGFLPASHQGTLIRGGDRPILDLRAPEGISSEAQRGVLDLIGRLNAHHLDRARTRRRARGPHPDLRAGVPDAKRGPRGRRPGERVGRDEAALRARRGPDRRVRHPLPAGTPAGRARGPVRSALFGRRQRLGRPRQRRGQPRHDVRPNRQADRRPAQGPETARAAREHARDLGRRVWTHADVRERQGPRSQPARVLLTGWPAAA